MVLQSKILVFLIVMPFLTFGQKKCVDSFENKSLHTDRFKFISSGIPAPILDNDSSVIYSAQGYHIKKDKHNIIEWTKSMGVFTSLHFTGGNNEIVGAFNNQVGNNASTWSQGLFKLSTNGALIWAKKIQMSLAEFNNYGYLVNTQKGPNDDIILSNAIANKISITILNSDASVIKLFKNFSIALPDGHQLAKAVSVVGNNSLYLIAISQKLQTTPTQLTQSNLLLLKLNYTTGVVEKINYLHSNDEINAQLPVSGNIVCQGVFANNFTAKIVHNTFLHIAGRKANNSFDNNRIYSIKVDTNLNVIKNAIYTATSHTYFSAAPETVPFIDNDGNMVFAALNDTTNIAGTSNSCYYFTANNNLDVITQKHLSAIETGLNTNGYKLNAVPLLKWDNNVEVIFHTNSSENDSVLHIVEIPSKIEAAPCRGQDFTYLSSSVATFTPLTAPVIVNLNSVSLNISPANLNIQNGNSEERKFCIQKSICDTIKLMGSSKFCLPNDTATFNLFKNPQCLRKTVWHIDTSVIKITSTPDDTSIRVKFLRPFRGYIKAQFEGCVLADSFWIEVNSPVRLLNLGNDTTLCPGKSILLDAGAGFKSYSWQDGSDADTFLVKQPGLYYLNVTDSCDNNFIDSVLVSANNVMLDLSYPAKICMYDTATIPLNSLLRNYTWQPPAPGILQGSQLKLFPNVSTLFNVSASPFPGCTVSDTILINVEDCPIYIYVPNAFSPNNDGLNEYFKPTTRGTTRQYIFNIYNRYGQQVFRSTSTGDGWNGISFGAPQSAGTYVWTCYYQFLNQEPKMIKGTVILIR